MSGPGEDELARLQQELAEAQAVIAELTRENAALAHGAKRTGASAQKADGQHREQPAELSRPAPSQVYRSPDPRVEAEDALAKANATIATLRIDKAILQSQSAGRARRSYGLQTVFVALPVIAGVAALVWFAPGSAYILVFGAVLLAIGGLLLHLIGTIPPRDGPPPPTPPLYPGL